jgi:hypothetical protein
VCLVVWYFFITHWLLGGAQGCKKKHSTPKVHRAVPD